MDKKLNNALISALRKKVEERDKTPIGGFMKFINFHPYGKIIRKEIGTQMWCEEEDKAQGVPENIPVNVKVSATSFLENYEVIDFYFVKNKNGIYVYDGDSISVDTKLKSLFNFKKPSVEIVRGFDDSLNSDVTMQIYYRLLYFSGLIHHSKYYQAEWFKGDYESMLKLLKNEIHDNYLDKIYKSRNNQ